MALGKNYYSKKLDITKNNCYWKLSKYNGISGGKDMLRCELHCYVDKSTADTNRDDITGFSFEFIPDLGSTDNLFKQAYLYLKTLDEFSSATDL